MNGNDGSQQDLVLYSQFVVFWKSISNLWMSFLSWRTRDWTRVVPISTTDSPKHPLGECVWIFVETPHSAALAAPWLLATKSCIGFRAASTSSEASFCMVQLFDDAGLGIRRHLALAHDFFPKSVGDSIRVLHLFQDTGSCAFSDDLGDSVISIWHRHPVTFQLKKVFLPGPQTVVLHALDLWDNMGQHHHLTFMPSASSLQRWTATRATCSCWSLEASPVL